MNCTHWAVTLVLLTSCASSPPAATRTSEASPPGAGGATITVKAPAVDSMPVSPQRPVTDLYHGVAVVDPYRWLEADGDVAVQQWTAMQNAYARRVLDELPDLAAIRSRVQAVLKDEVASYPEVESVAGTWFVRMAAPPKQQPLLGVLPASSDASASAFKVLVDPNVLDASGRTAIDWFVPSPDAKRVAVSLSKSGTESGDVTVYDIATGQALADMIPHVNGGTAGGDVAWLADGTGFFYTRYPHAGERPAEDLPFYQQIYFHALGSDTQTDRYELGKDFPRIAEVQLDLDPSSGRLLASVQKGDGGQFAHFLREKNGTWKQLSDFADQVVEIRFAPRERLLVLSRREAPRGQLLITDERAPTIAHARVLVPQAQESLVSRFDDPRTLTITDSRIYATYQLGGPSEIRAFDLRGKALPFKAPLEIASVAGLSRDGKNGIVFQSQSFLEPAAWYRYDEKSGQVKKSALADQSPVSLSEATVARETATSKDGTLVPYNVVMPKTLKLDGSNACIATGYGGYGVNLEPRFRADTALWIEQGMCLAVANLRGGAEFGDSWHVSGSLLNKQNVFDDFAAVLQALVQKGYTKPERLGIIGGSNGGLLMGATLVQHPELFRAAVSLVGIYDMLRVELQPNGAFNATEFGSVQDPEQFKALYAYSPYHHVQVGTAYPATLLTTGENDPRVGPMQSRKMAARLQDAAKGGGPILFRSNAAAGHGNDMALDDRVAQRADLGAFLMSRLGVGFRAPTAPAPQN